MSPSQAQKVGQLIGVLNGISVGELGVITGKLSAIRPDLNELQSTDLDQTLDQALQAIQRGDVKDFRRLVAQLVSKLGHLRDRPA
jgi:hypothetical protein